MRKLAWALTATFILGAGKADSPKKKAPLDFSVGDLGDLPKAEGLQSKSTEAPKLDEPTAGSSKATYEVVKVVHAQQVLAHGDSYEAHQPITKVEVSNLPTVLPGFHTWVRVRSPEKLGATITVRLVDPGGRTVADSDGDLVFGGRPEADFVVDWTSLQVNKPGAYRFQVLVAGDQVGESPLPVIQQLHATLSETAPDAGS